MSAWRRISWRETLSLVLSLILAFALVPGMVWPALGPVYAAPAPRETGLAASTSPTLPVWWLATRADWILSARPAAASRVAPAWPPPQAPLGAVRERTLRQGIPIDHFDFLNYPASATAGVPFNATIRAVDASGTLTLPVNDTISLVTSNGGTITPPTATLTAGVWNGTISLTTAGANRTVTAVSGTITGQMSITINPASASYFGVTVPPGPQQAGADFALDIEAYDPYGNLATGYAGTATLADTTGTIQPTAAGFTAGAWSETVSITQAATGVVISATDGPISGTSSPFTVAPGALAELEILTTVGQQTAGAPFSVDIEARDAWGNLATNYSGRPQLSDSTGTLLPTQTGVGCFLNDGVCSQSVSVTRAGSGDRITAAAPGGIQANSNFFTVVPAALAKIRINSAPDNGGASFGGPVEVGGHSMTIYDTFTMWAAGYDAYDNYRNDVSVSWDRDGVLSTAQIAPNPAISATLTPAPILSGTGQVDVTYNPGGLVDSTGNIVVQAPWLVVNKIGPASAVPAGTENVSYTIEYENVGDADARDVRITDTYDSNVSFSLAVPPPQLVDGNVTVWTRSLVRAGDPPGTINVFVDVDGSLTPGTIITNRVEIGGSRVETHSAFVTTVVTAQPDLTVGLSDLGNDPVEAGDPFNLQVTYANAGTGLVENIVLTLALDTHLTFLQSGIAPVVVPAEGNGNVGRWELGTLGAFSGDSFIVQVKVDDYMPDQYGLVNEAQIQSDSTPPAFDTEVTTVDAPALALSKSAAPNPVMAFNPLTYTLVYSNVGHASASALYITDAVPAGVDYQSCSPAPCNRSGDNVVWQPGPLAAGGSGVAHMQVLVQRNLDSGTVLTNHARVRIFDTPDYSATARITTTVVSSPSLILNISDGTSGVEAGEELVYVLNYHNAGTGRAYTSTIVATPPPSQLVENLSCLPVASCAVQSGQVLFDLGSVAGGESGTVQMLVRVKDPLPPGGLSIEATAVVNTATPGDPPGDNYAQDTDQVLTRPDLQLDVDYHSHTPYPGKRLTYTLSYSNAGHIGTTGVVVTAAIPKFSAFDPLASDAWQEIGDGLYRRGVGGLDYSQREVALLVATLPTGTFTTTMPNFDAAFGIYDSGVSGADAEPADNSGPAPLGVPDLFVQSVDVDWSAMLDGLAGPYITVTVANQGGGIACNSIPGPGGDPNFCGGFYVDVYFNPAPENVPASYPSDENIGDIFTSGIIVMPHATQDVTFTFDLEEVLKDDREPYPIYVRLDNLTPDRPFGSVAEYNELNNVSAPYVPTYPNNVYLPLWVQDG